MSFLTKEEKKNMKKKLENLQKENRELQILKWQSKNGKNVEKKKQRTT